MSSVEEKYSLIVLAKLLREADIQILGELHMSSIREILAEKGIEVIGFSDVGNKINGFDSWISKSLFSFLINNQLNRYLFNAIIRIGNLDIENWPFNLEILSSQKIREKVKESFIKKITCGSCGQVLYSESYVDLASLSERREIECPKCKLTFEIKYDSLEDSYDLSKHIISEFMEQLAYRDVVKQGFLKHCLKCRDKRPIEFIEKFDNSQLRCEKCGQYCVLGKSYSMKEPFLSDCLIRRGGDWFEWYVYQLCSYTHEEVEHNLIIKTGKDGKQIELDVIGRDGDKLTIYECKDTQNLSGWKDFENIPDIIENFENVTLVNSYDSDRKGLKKLLEPHKKDISIIKGSDLEDNFLGVEPTLLRLKSNEWPYNKNGVNSFEKLAQDKKIEIIGRLLDEILVEKDLSANLQAFLKISDNNYYFKSLLLRNEIKSAKAILKKFSEKIDYFKSKNKKPEDKLLLAQIILFYREMFEDLEKKDLLEILDFKSFFLLFLSSLGEKSNDEVINAANRYYVKLFRICDRVEILLSPSETTAFFEPFLQTIRFGNWSRREDTILTLEGMLLLLDNNQLNKLILSLKENVSTYSWSINAAIVSICKKIFNKLDGQYQAEVKNILIMMAQVKQKNSNEYANEALTFLFPK